MNNLYLIGMMGSGKSSTAACLSLLYNSGSGQPRYSFVDLDEWVEKKSGMSIPKIFSEEGEKSFRQRENGVLEEISKKDYQIVATGGGVILESSNVKRMKKTGKIIYLKTSLDDLWNRVKVSISRPLLSVENPKAELAQIFKKRQKLYEKAAHVTVLTDGKSAGRVAQDIFDTLLCDI